MATRSIDLFQVAAPFIFAAAIMLATTPGTSQEPTNKNLASGTVNQQPDVPKFELVRSIDGQSPASKKYSITKKDGILQVVDRKTGDAVGPPLDHELAAEWSIECWAFSPDDKWLVTGTAFLDKWNPENYGQIYVWEIATGKLVAKYRGVDEKLGSLRDLAFPKRWDGRSIFVSADRRKADEEPTVPNFRIVRSIDGRSPPSKKYSVTKKYGILQVVDKKTGDKVGPALGHKLSAGWSVNCWEFSPDDKWLVTGTGFVDGNGPENFGDIYVWESSTGMLIKKFRGGDERLGSVA